LPLAARAQQPAMRMIGVLNYNAAESSGWAKASIWAADRDVPDHACRTMFDSVNDTSILKIGRFPRYQRSPAWGQRSGRATAATIAKRFSALALLAGSAATQQFDCNPKVSGPVTGIVNSSRIPGQS
jgi:hypothetical protein